MADIPGIIEGASEGRGLGIQFLKHIERNAVLLFVIPVDVENAGGQYDTLLAELQAFNPELLDKPRLLALTKTDLLPPDMAAEFVADISRNLPADLQIVAVSAVAHQGLDVLKESLWKEVQTAHEGREL
jgi:GTPase